MLRVLWSRLFLCRFRRRTGLFRHVLFRVHCGRLSLAVEILYAPPYWVHALLWGPLILIIAILPLRPVKGLLIALQHQNKAEESRFTGGEAP